eukprot:1502909-Rhodomonas_salina.1
MVLQFRFRGRNTGEGEGWGLVGRGKVWGVGIGSEGESSDLTQPPMPPTALLPAPPFPLRAPAALLPRPPLPLPPLSSHTAAPLGGEEPPSPLQNLLALIPPSAVSAPDIPHQSRRRMHRRNHPVYNNASARHRTANRNASVTTSQPGVSRHVFDCLWFRARDLEFARRQGPGARDPARFLHCTIRHVSTAHRVTYARTVLEIVGMGNRAPQPVSGPDIAYHVRRTPADITWHAAACARSPLVPSSGIPDLSTTAGVATDAHTIRQYRTP